MRCRALAQAWQAAGGEPALFVAARLGGTLEQWIAADGALVERTGTAPGSTADAAATVDLARDAGATWVVLDGYHFDDDYQLEIKRAGMRLLMLDDYGHASRYYADIVLNQNLYASEELYPHREPGTRLLLGTRYALLRREFWRWRGAARERPTPERVRNVLVTMGGSDPENATGVVLHAARMLADRDVRLRVVVGPANVHREELEREAGRSGGCVELLSSVSDMPELMAWADLAISAAGSSCWELAFMGVPAIVVVLAENQLPIARALASEGIAHDLGWRHELTAGKIASSVTALLDAPARRREMAARGQAAVDGLGGERVAAEMRRSDA
jgi:UDP-2,4-diacetamido-2,4,6-trideoxy-beta-L-altropyranose hydrolase